MTLEERFAALPEGLRIAVLSNSLPDGYWAHKQDGNTQVYALPSWKLLGVCSNGLEAAEIIHRHREAEANR